MSRVPDVIRRQPLPPDLDAFAWSARTWIARRLFHLSVRIALLALRVAPWAKSEDER